LFNVMGRYGVCGGVGDKVVGWKDDRFSYLLCRTRSIHIPRCWSVSGINFNNRKVFSIRRCNWVASRLGGKRKQRWG
jgi:hypothetical protein